MTAIATAQAGTHPLPRPYDTPPAAEALRPTPATMNLVRTQINALLTSSSAFHSMPSGEQRKLADNLTKVSAYCAELIRDDWCQSVQRLDQRPVVRSREVAEGPVVRAQAAGDDFKPAAANQVARVTKDTLRAIAFPTFVADLIKGTFNAITQSSIQQMEAYTKLLENVGKTVDQFMSDNISDLQAVGWLAQSYPDHIKIEKDDGGAAPGRKKGGSAGKAATVRAVPADGADDHPPPNFKADLNLGEDVSLDESSIEEKLVPAARRKLAQTRLQQLSTLVLMGINRIVVTGGKIRATMGFHIDTTDRAHAEEATDLDTRVAAAGSFGFGPWSASLSTSVTYVSSTRKDSDSELHVDADLTGEVEIHFKSDYFPLERFANTAAVGRIQSNTAVPENNPPPPGPFDRPPSVGGEVGAYKSARTRRTAPRAPSLPKIGTPPPDAKLPVKPAEPEVKQRTDMDWTAEKEWAKFKKPGAKQEGGAKKEGGAKEEGTKEKPAAEEKKQQPAVEQGAEKKDGEAVKKPAADGKEAATKESRDEPVGEAEAVAW
ncbi:MAG: hypothetical protein ACJ754_00390 [Pyrinomonadaceae bacterium]